jgi:hypothetical protein
MPNAVKRTPENSKSCVYFQESEAAELFQAFSALKSCIFPLFFFFTETNHFPSRLDVHMEVRSWQISGSIKLLNKDKINFVISSNVLKNSNQFTAQF